MLGINLFILILLILLSSIFSSSETAIFSLSIIKARRFLNEKRKGAEALIYLKENPHNTLITILILNNLVNIAASSLATIISINLFGSKGIGFAIGVTTILILIFGEVTPKSLALRYSPQIALLTSRPIKFLLFLLYPITFSFNFLTKPFLSIENKETLSEEEIKEIVTLGREEGVLNKQTAEILKNVINFKENIASDIMTPFNSVIYIDSEKHLSEVIDEIIKYKFSRYPIFDDKTDTIVGILHIDSILRNMNNKNLKIRIKDISEKPFFIPETKRVEELLKELQSNVQKMAIVLNEYGSVIGIVTLTDILEEIIGDIFDRNDRKSIYIRKLSSKDAIVDARASIDEINEVLNIGLADSHFNTISGLIQHKLGKIPERGDFVNLKKIKLEVLSANPTKVKKIRITKK